MLLAERNDDLLSQLLQLSKNVYAVSTSTLSSCAVTTISSSAKPKSAFKPLRAETTAHQKLSDECQAFRETFQFSEPGNVTAVQDFVRNDYLQLQDKNVSLDCISFELANQLKDTRKKLVNAEIRAEEAEKQTAEAREHCMLQEKNNKCLEAEYSETCSIMEKELKNLREELNAKNEQYCACIAEKNKQDEKMKQWQFAVDEMKAVHSEIQMLEKQVNLDWA
ncbi:unnamed protein product [Thelazia callipaeda]|uniref:TACC_C domain-containing protein n=1 Tax=Thelazia callipaeda TaxID=103827 RepID=A0A0N5CWS6_THECL|nr:unnamed protein product [Thelazia callipaeda]